MPKCTSYMLDMHMHIHIMHIRAYPSMTARCAYWYGQFPPEYGLTPFIAWSFMQNMYLMMNIWKKPNSGYDYMHIRVLSGFIFKIFNISRQHWLTLWVILIVTLSGTQWQNKVMSSVYLSPIVNFFFQKQWRECDVETTTKNGVLNMW
jgi:hypothetical protein